MKSIVILHLLYLDTKYLNTSCLLLLSTYWTPLGLVVYTYNVNHHLQKKNGTESIFYYIVD